MRIFDTVGEVLTGMWERGLVNIESRLRYSRMRGINPVAELVNRGLVTSGEIRAYLADIGRMQCVHCGQDIDGEHLVCMECFHYHAQAGYQHDEKRRVKRSKKGDA